MQFNYTLTSIQSAAEELWNIVKDNKVLAFHGVMGAGKTSFIHALCDFLEVESSVGSPTYSIINQYQSKKAGTIYHMDLYRLKDEEEALQAGVEDAIYSGNLCFVEWPEKAPGLFPENTAHIYIDIVNEDSRTITVKL